MSLVFDIILIFGVPGKPPCVRCERGEWGHWLGEVAGVPGRQPCRLCDEVMRGPRQARKQTGKQASKKAGKQEGQHLNIHILQCQSKSFRLVRCKNSPGSLIAVGEFCFKC